MCFQSNDLGQSFFATLRAAMFRKELAETITKNRGTISQKVSQLALYHISILDAVWGLRVMLGVLLTIAVSQPSTTHLNELPT